MATNARLQNIDLWEAWVDMQCTNEGVVTLYVIGEVCVNNAILVPRFEKMTPLPGMEDRLYLQIVPNVLSDEGLETEILYAEELGEAYQYTGVTVFAGKEIVVEIDGLEYIH